MAGGSGEALASFVAAVHELISAEHRQWLENAETTAKAVERLHAILEEQKAARGDG